MPEKGYICSCIIDETCEGGNTCTHDMLHEYNAGCVEQECQDTAPEARCIEASKHELPKIKLVNVMKEIEDLKRRIDELEKFNKYVDIRSS